MMILNLMIVSRPPGSSGSVPFKAGHCASFSSRSTLHKLSPGAISGCRSLSEDRPLGASSNLLASRQDLSQR